LGVTVSFNPTFNLGRATVRKRKIMAKSQLKLVAPTTENRTVATPLRRPNAELRSREYLTDAEVGRLTAAAKDNRYGHHDSTMILLAYRHGFSSLLKNLEIESFGILVGGF
jgi:hypothetical protein